MIQSEFNKVLNETIELCKNTLNAKAEEYARGDRLHNLKRAGEKRHMTPEKALLGMQVKHEVSIDDMIDDLDSNILNPMELWDEKIKDAINYYILLRALIVERHQNKTI